MIRSTKPYTVEPIPQWQTVYCSLILLLVVFFVMLIAYSAVNRDRFKQLKGDAVAGKDPTVQLPVANPGMQSLQQLVARLGMETTFSVVKTADGFKAVVPNPVLFRSGEASLDGAAYSILDGIIKIAELNDLAIQVEGHTDSVAIETAQFSSNWELSTMRAVNILRYLEKNGGISHNRLTAVGFAEYQPISDNNTPEGRQKNRRIEIRFKHGI